MVSLSYKNARTDDTHLGSFNIRYWGLDPYWTRYVLFSNGGVIGTYDAYSYPHPDTPFLTGHLMPRKAVAVLIATAIRDGHLPCEVLL